MKEFSMDRFVSKCVAEFGAAAPFALRSGCAPTSELDARLCGEYAVSFVDGEFDFTVGETVSGVFRSCESCSTSSSIQLVRNAVCTPLAASDMLDMCVVEIEVRLTRLVVGAVVSAMLSRHDQKPEQTTLACIPDALLVRIADLAIDDLRLARAEYVSRRDIAEYELDASAPELPEYRRRRGRTPR
jgi:hypothetical protein